MRTSRGVLVRHNLPAHSSPPHHPLGVSPIEARRASSPCTIIAVGFLSEAIPLRLRGYRLGGNVDRLS
jgi:hypothetical protein